MDVQVVQIDPTTHKVSFGFSPVPVSGITKLAQIVVLSLMTVPGKDVLDPDLGGGIPELVGRNLDPDDTTEIFAAVAQCVKKTQREILISQIGSTAPPEERLRDIEIVSVTPGEQADEILVKLRVITEAGKAVTVVL